MDLVRVLLPVALLGNGLAAGGLMIAVLGGAPLLLSLPTERYVPTHQFMVTRFDPFMPACMLSALLCDLVLAVAAPTAHATALFVAAALLLVGAIVVSLTKNVPINRWIATVDPQALPPNWEQLDPRVRWSNWNRVRTALVVVALAVLVVDTGILL
ncbi:anthrone oxygenase family protein [Streptomyces sp. NPDC059063]|uniref:anthrone oxygenase family protein n=1 Tax=unclassified Streptomyces TaxID=2593676 RepID=UPI0036B2D1A2